MVPYGRRHGRPGEDTVMAAYNWYPGHMAKARRQMSEDIGLIDIIVELVDARAPLSTRNPDIEKLGGGKGRIIVLNKADLAEADVNERWIKKYESEGIKAVALNSKDKQSFAGVKKVIDEAAAKKKERDLKRGIKNRPVRLLVAGIPNVGKSTFINSLCRKNIAKTGNKPGVTKGKQWISIGKGVELMDTPGILWPKIEDHVSQVNLAIIGSMNDEAINRDELFVELVKMLESRAEAVMSEKYGIVPGDDPALAAAKAAKELGMLRAGGEPDTKRAEEYLMNAFRSGALGRISLEEP